MFSALISIMLLSITDRIRLKSSQHRPLNKTILFIFVGNFLILMILGSKHVESPFIEFGQISTVSYFAFFNLIVFTISLFENIFSDLTIGKSYLFIKNIIIKLLYNNLNIRFFSSTSRKFVPPYPRGNVNPKFGFPQSHLVPK